MITRIRRNRREADRSVQVIVLILLIDLKTDTVKTQSDFVQEVRREDVRFTEHPLAGVVRPIAGIEIRGVKRRRKLPGGRQRLIAHAEAREHAVLVGDFVIDTHVTLIELIRLDWIRQIVVRYARRADRSRGLRRAR